MVYVLQLVQGRRYVGKTTNLAHLVIHNLTVVNFGDPNMEIKRDDPARRRNFRARHKCDTAKDKTTPRYWSCRFWSKKPVSSMASEDVLAWDDEEKFSEWGWDDESFAQHQDLLNAYPFLNDIKEVVEDTGDL